MKTRFPIVILTSGKISIGYNIPEKRDQHIMSIICPSGETGKRARLRI